MSNIVPPIKNPPWQKFPPYFTPLGYFEARTSTEISTSGDIIPLTYYRELFKDQFEYINHRTLVAAVDGTGVFEGQDINFDIALFYDKVGYEAEFDIGKSMIYVNSPNGNIVQFNTLTDTELLHYGNGNFIQRVGNFVLGGLSYLYLGGGLNYLPANSFQKYDINAKLYFELFSWGNPGISIGDSAISVNNNKHSFIFGVTYQEDISFDEVISDKILEFISASETIIETYSNMPEFFKAMTFKNADETNIYYAGGKISPPDSALYKYEIANNTSINTGVAFVNTKKTGSAFAFQDKGAVFVADDLQLYDIPTNTIISSAISLPVDYGRMGNINSNTGVGFVISSNFNTLKLNMNNDSLSTLPTFANEIDERGGTEFYYG
jgi:hypothetical protein